MTAVLLAMVESAAGSRLFQLGAQLTLLGGLALGVGALCLFIADRNRGRQILLAGLALFAVGGALRSFEELGVMTLNYFPGWEEDANQVLNIDHADFEYGDDDFETDDPVPAWWEGLLWWGQRFGLVLGAILATTGLVMEGRMELKRPQGKTKRARKKAVR